MKKWQIILIHLVYWLIYFAWGEWAAAIFNKGHSFDWGQFASPLFVGQYLVFLVPFYLNYFIVMPRYFKRSKIVESWLSWVGLLMFFIGFRYLIQEFLFFKWFNSHNYSAGVNLVYYAFDNVYFGINTLMVSTFIWTGINWTALQQERTKLAKEKNEAELKFLKAQVNPHFLFNTLNNIYSLVYHKSDKALPAIMQLSELMRFMTTDASADTIMLDKELQYIERFIALESLRTQEEPAIRFSITGSAAGKRIAPLMLIPFIENGFKHGVVTDKAALFVITITIQDNELVLHTRNKINRKQKDSAGGVGLDNVRRRLVILYPNKYQLQVQQQDDIYICDLSIKL